MRPSQIRIPPTEVKPMDIRLAPRSLAKVVALTTCLVTGSALAVCYCTGKIQVKKFYDTNANGIHDAGEPRLSGWPMLVESSSQSVSTQKPTDSYGYALFGSLHPATDYTVREGTPLESNWVQSAPVDSAGNPINPQTGIKVYAGKTTQVKFGNYCTKGSGGRTLD
jgi:hypothetical protein